MGEKTRRVILLTFLTVFAITIFSGPAAAKVLTLEEAYRRALKENDRVARLKEEVRRAEAEVTDATANFLPRLDLEATATRGRSRIVTPTGETTRTEDHWRAQATLSQPIFKAGKLLSTRELARLRMVELRHRYFRRTQAVLFDVARLFFGVKLARNRVNILENTLRRAKKQRRRAKALKAEGMITRTPVLRAEVQVAEVERELERAKNGLRLNLSELRLELGGGTVPPEVQVGSDPDTGLEPLKNYYRRAVEKRRDYLGTRKKLAAAREQVEVELADRYPSLNFRATGTHFDEKIADENQEWAVAGVLSYPLFSGGGEEADVDRARALYRQAEAGLRRLKDELRVQVEEAYRNFETRLKTLEALESQVEAAEENHREVTARFEEGLADAVDVSDAITVLNEAELELASSRINLLRDRLALELASGVFVEDLLTARLNS